LSNVDLWALLCDRFISELTEFPFIAQNRVGFETQLMVTTKFSLTVNKILFPQSTNITLGSQTLAETPE
jgi:hypothetical protein